MMHLSSCYYEQNKTARDKQKHQRPTACVRVLLTLHGQSERLSPRPLLSPLLHHAGDLPAVIRRCGDQPVLAPNRHRAVRPVRGGRRMIASHRRQPLDGGCWFPVHRLALGHHHRPAAGLDRHNFGRVLGLGWTNRKMEKKERRGRLNANGTVKKRAFLSVIYISF